MSAVEEELLELSRKLLTAIDTGDWTTYESLCDESITCFEPEALGQVVAGMAFHKFYFDLPSSPTRPAKQSTIASPHIRVVGQAAIVSYVRVVQKLDGTGAPISAAAMETRVWEKKSGGWKHVHFHRSPVN
jgi:calcium/calmodulin-dependent protein kinase (CaM kinase) II